MRDVEEVSLTKAARNAMAKVNSYEEGAQELLRAARADSMLYAALVGPHEIPLALAAVRSATREERRAIWSRPTAPDDRVHALARAVYGTLLDMRLPGGKRLGDCTADDLLDAAAFYREASEDMAHKARWLLAIADALPSKRKTVGKAFDDARLAALQEETK